MQILQSGGGKLIAYLDMQKGVGKIEAIWVEKVDE